MLIQRELVGKAAATYCQKAYEIQIINSESSSPRKALKDENFRVSVSDFWPTDLYEQTQLRVHTISRIKSRKANSIDCLLRDYY